MGIYLSDIQAKSLEQQIKALESQNNVLKETQYDRALAMLKTQKEIHEMEKANLESEKSDKEKEIRVLRLAHDKKVALEKMADLERKIAEIKENIQTLNAAQKRWANDPVLHESLRRILQDATAARREQQEYTNK